MLESVSDVFELHDYQAQFIKHMIDARLDHHEGVWQKKKTGQIYYLVANAIKRKRSDDEFIKNGVRVIGYFFISVDLGFLNDLMIEGVEKQGIDYFLSDKNGTILFSPNVNLSSSTFATLNTISERLRKVISSRSSSINLYSETDFPFYGGYKRLTQDLYLLGTISEEDLLVSSNALREYIFWFVSIVVVISILLIIGHVNTVLTNPINIIRRLVVKFKKGEYDQDTSSLGSDELAMLAGDFKALSIGLAENSETVKNLAYYDSLTGLPNRITFNVNLEKAINHCERGDTVLGLLFIDLDNFKAANDLYGHQAGDLLLKETAVRLESCLRGADVVSRKLVTGGDWSSDLVVRLGGDEFTIILTNIEQAHQASMVAQRVVDVLSHPFEISGAEISIGASIGIAMYPVDGTKADSLIKSADLAMYEAKQKGRNNYQFFTKALNESVAKRMEVEVSLRKAIDDQEFFLEYQPKVRLTDGEVVAVEALVRWRHPSKGILHPANFIKVAEDTGLVTEIGHIVLQMVCRQLRDWRQQDMGHLKVAINLSALQLMRGSIVENIHDVLREYDVSPENLEIEISENALFTDEERSKDILNKLRSMGVHISLCGFGIGYSSLTFIRDFPLDSLKIDRSFIVDIDDNTETEALLRALLAISNALSLKVTIEGVESLAQLQIIDRMPCDYVQGFYFSKPVPHDKLPLHFSIPS